MRNRKIDEYEALFEQASIPVLAIPQLELTRIAVAFVGTELDGSAQRIALRLARRFDAQVQAFYTPAGHAAAEQAAESANWSLASKPPASADQSTDNEARRVADQAVAAAINAFDPHLLILPQPADADVQFADLDTLVESVHAPVFIFRQPIEYAGQPFERPLHYLTGAFEQKRNFAYSFHLVATGGEVFVKHVINEDEIDEVKAALSLSEMIDDGTMECVLKELTRAGERYLKGVVAGAEHLPCTVRYDVSVGDVLESVEKEMAAGKHTLLVVGAHVQGRSHLDARVYQLMHQIKSAPVLAL